MSLKAKKEERGTKYQRVAALEKITKDEKRGWTPEELTEFETLETEIRTLTTEITVLEAQERAAMITAARAAGTPVQGQHSEGEERDLSQYSIRKAILSVSSRNSKLDGLELEMHQEAEKEARAFGKDISGEAVAVPSMVLDRMFQKRDITTSTGNGSYTIVDGVNGYVEALRERSLALQLGAEYLTGLTGNFDVPRENALYTPGWKAETATVDESSPTMARAAYSPKRLGGFMDVSKQLIIQSAVGIEARLRNQILLGNAEAIDQAAWNGSGASNDPTGILNDADVPVLGIATDGGAITKVLIETLVQRLEEAKGMSDNTRWVVSPILKRILKNITMDSGSGKFIWSDNAIDGIAALATTHIPKNLTKGAGTALTAAVLGDLRNTMFGQWGGLEILPDPYTQAVSGMIRLVVNQYVDFHVIQPGRFQVIKDITTA